MLLVVPHILLLLHMFNSVRYFLDHGDHPFLIYHACIDPYSFYDIPIFKLLIIDNAMIFLYQLITVLGNIYVWKYLRRNTENNVALKEVDKKKERKRNFVSAKNGIRTAVALVISYFYNSIFYGFKVNMCLSNKFQSNSNAFKVNLDTGTKAFLNSCHNDLWMCLIMPILVLLDNSNTKRKLVNIKRELKIHPLNIKHN